LATWHSDTIGAKIANLAGKTGKRQIRDNPMQLNSNDTLLKGFDAQANGAARGGVGSKARTHTRRDGVVIGTLAAWDDVGNPLVDYPGNPWDCFLAALSTVPLTPAALGREVALMFVDGDPRQPMVIGLVQPPKPPTAEVDGERLEFTAAKEIVLRCGEASIMLTRAGKVILRGTYLLSRSSGVNRIKGGSVQIN
jgi:hypothetical protein